jgi:hypothetical protein
MLVAFDLIPVDSEIGFHEYFNNYVFIYWIILISVDVFMIRRILSFKNIESKSKWNWIWFIVFMGNIGILFYVWSQDDIFIKANSAPTAEQDIEEGHSE